MALTCYKPNVVFFPFYIQPYPTLPYPTTHDINFPERRPNPVVTAQMS